MKRKLLLILFLLTACICNAQVYLGLGLGRASSVFTAKPGDLVSQDFKNRAGVISEVIVEPFVTEHFSLPVFVGYIQKGSEATMLKKVEPDYVYFRSGDYSLNTLVIQVLPRIEFFKKFKFFLNAGPYFAYILSAKINGSGTVQIGGKDTPTDINLTFNQDINRQEFGITYGAGFKFPFKERFEFVLNARNSIGFLNTGHEKIFPVKLNSIEITAGINYPIAGIKEHKKRYIKIH